MSLIYYFHKYVFYYHSSDYNQKKKIYNQKFTFTVSDSACIQLEIEIQTDSIISKQNVEAAIKFGISPSDTVDTKKYIIAFMKKLLLQREKIQRNLLQAHLDASITKLWTEMLSSLEEESRTLVNIHTGSLIFTLFCPKGHSLLQLPDSRWLNDLREKVDKLLNA